MIKNKLSIFGLCTVLMFGTLGCSDWLDIKPEGEAILDEYWKTESQVQAVVASCYRSLTETDNVYRMIVWGELRSDNLIEGKSTDGELNKVIDVDINTSNPFSNWSAMYRTINYCNTFLHFAPGVIAEDDNFTEGKLRALQAEVLTIRALAYFYLVRAFKEVPYITTPSIDDTQDYQVVKASEEEILQNIITDLKVALNFARFSYGDEVSDKGRITYNAVQSLLADVYLWDEQYAKCVEACDAVLSDEELELVEADEMYFQVFYLGNSTESIFELQFDDDEIINYATRDLYGYRGEKSGQLSFPPFLADPDSEKSPFSYKTTVGMESEYDIRRKDFLDLSNTAEGLFYIFKYAGISRFEDSNELSSYSHRSSTSNWIVYRLSDIMLMRAEALVQLNRSQTDLQSAMDMVNATYLRANPDLSGDSLQLQAYSTAIDIEKLVLRERQRELMFEGKRWFDLMRLARRTDSPGDLLQYVAQKFSGDAGLQYSKMSIMDALYFPILQSEIEANPNLIQNPFYELTGNSSSSN